MNRTSGFSLIELLVVLALFGLLTTLLPQGLQRLYASSRAESEAYAIAGNLQDCALRALQKQETQVVGTGQGANCIVDSATDVELVFENGIAPVFYADGSSNGGRIVLTHELRKIFIATNRINANVRVYTDDSR